VGTLENKFSWSNSRAAMFDRCPRSYWWQYYGSWGGWERNAPTKTRLAYVLKNLSSRWAWVGSAVHEAVEHVLLRIRDQAAQERFEFAESRPDVDREVEALTERMRAQYRQSLSRKYRDRPKHSFGLMEHEYEDPVTREEWQETSEKARLALRAFLESDVFEHIRTSDPTTWIAIEQLDQFILDGVGVWAVPDFVRHAGDGGAELYDWKTGAVKPERSRLQMACYTLYMQDRHGVRPATLTNRLVYLGEQVAVHEFVFDEATLREAREEIRESMARMQARLSDVAGNVADPANFPLTDHLKRCRTCVYRRLCGR